MELKISYLNTEVSDNTENVQECTWYSRWKTYTSDFMEEDMINSTVSRKVDRIILNDCQLADKKSVDDLIMFLTKAQESFKY